MGHLKQRNVSSKIITHCDHTGKNSFGDQEQIVREDEKQWSYENLPKPGPLLPQRAHLILCLIRSMYVAMN